MNTGYSPVATKPSAKRTVLLMDSDAERRASRRKILGLHGIEVIGASDLTDASSMWHRDRYNLVLMDIRRDYRGCIAWRDEVKKESPKQIVAFLVGHPRYVDLEPLPDSYVAEEHGFEWGGLLRRTLQEACNSLPHRNGFAEVGYQIAMARKMRGLPPYGMQAEDAPDDAPMNIIVTGPDED